MTDQVFIALTDISMRYYESTILSSEFISDRTIHDLPSKVSRVVETLMLGFECQLSPSHAPPTDYEQEKTHTKTHSRRLGNKATKKQKHATQKHTPNNNDCS